MVVADVAVVFVRARGLPAAAPLAGWRAAAPVVGRVLPAVVAGNGVDGCFVVRIDGGDGVAPPPRVQLVRLLRHLGTVLEVLRNNMVDHVGGEAEEERGHEVRAGGRVWRQQGLHLPHHLRWLHVADFRELMQLECSGPAAMVYLDISKAFSCSYASAAISARLLLMLLQMSVGRAESR